MSPVERASALRSPTPEVLTEFILSLVQAFLRTGYYLPDHPQSKKAKAGLYDRFKSLFTGRHELTFMLKETGEVRDILVDGPLPDTQPLRSLMTKGMAEVYVPRLSNFLERKELVSLTLKETMGEEEFSHFVDVMSEPSFQTLDSQARTHFVERLKAHNITHISFVFNEDMVSPDRKLPWRAQLSISRLKKDLKCIPLFQNLDEEGFRSLRRQVIRDVLRPINKPALMASILLNSDLAATREVAEEEIEDEVVAYIEAERLVETGQRALEAHEAAATGKTPEGRRRALVKFYRRLRASGLEGADELIRAFFQKSLIDFESLPADLQRQLTIEMETDRFLQDRTKMLVLYENSPSADVHRARGEYLLRIIPELARRDLLDEALLLITTFRGHASLGGFRAPNAAQLLETIIKGEIGRILKDRFLNGRKEDRIALAPIFQALGDGWIPHLLDILDETKDTWVRKNACETLLRMGSKAETELLKRLCGGGWPPEVVAEMLMVFGEAARVSPKVLHVLHQHVRHKEPRVREEAAWALCRLRGQEEEELFLKLLDDPAIEVRQRGLRCLRSIKSERGFARMIEILERLDEEPELKPLEVPIYQALAEFGDTTVPGGETTEQCLLRILEESYPGGLKSMLQRGPRRQLSTSSFFAILETLSLIGTEQSLAVLKSLRKRFREPFRTKLERAVEHIEARVHADDKEAQEASPAAV